MKRGRKPNPCPSHDELRRLASEDLRPSVLARKMGSHPTAIIRWLGEIGIEYKIKPGRKRGVVPPWVRISRTAHRRKHYCCLYNIWHSMRERCQCPTYRDYHYYGGRGITVCAEWQDYAVFRAWAVATGFGKDLTIDRRDPNGNYEPSNCRWATRKQQQETTRRAILKRSAAWSI